MAVRYLAEYRCMNDDELDAALFGLAVECPYGNCTRTCPLTPLRKQPLRERFLAITALSHDGKQRLMADLVDCFLDLEALQEEVQNT